jgi:hypothetical protein
MGILATIFFFHYTSPKFALNRAYSNTVNNAHGKPEIEMAYFEQEEIRTKMVSQ